MTTAALFSPGIDFDLPAELEVHDPPEARGVPRDGVRLMVSAEGAPPVHTVFSDLPRFLAPGDLLVVNTSGTLPAAVPVQRPGGERLLLHLSGAGPDGRQRVEPRRLAPDGLTSQRWTGRDLAGQTLHLPGGGRASLGPHHRDTHRLYLAEIELPEPLHDYLFRHGRPIRYGDVSRPWPISAYQTVYATEPGSAEMASAGRPLSPELITTLVARGVAVTPLLLHAGVSSLEAHERPLPEWYRVPPETAGRANATRGAGGRIIAVGTTVVRALESVADHRGLVHPGAGFTDLVVTPERGVWAVDGLVTGWHEPQASHLLMLEAIAGRAQLEEAYDAALQQRYRWHEFGDSHLILAAASSATG